MTFEAAKRKLAKIAKGEYHCIGYKLSIPSRKYHLPAEVRCSVYIHGENWYSADTWAGAFAMLKAGMDRRIKRRKRDPAEQPRKESRPSAGKKRASASL